MLDMTPEEMVYLVVMISSGFILILRLISRLLFGVILRILALKVTLSSKINLKIRYLIKIYQEVNSIRISSFTIFSLIY